MTIETVIVEFIRVIAIVGVYELSGYLLRRFVYPREKTLRW